MANVEGSVEVSGLPPHRGLIVNLYFYRVEGAEAPAPYGGDPPAEAATDCQQVFKQVDLNAERERASYDLPFQIEQPTGFYYLQLEAILFRVHAGKMLAQVEPFFFGRRPFHVTSEPEGTLTLPITWPSQSPDELHHYETLRPRAKMPWWRFW